MDFLARDQRGGRRDQVVILVRDIAAQVDDPARQHHVRQERQAPRIGFGLRKVEQADARRLQQHLDQRRFRRRAEHQAVDAPGQQFDGGRRVGQVADRQCARHDIVGVEQLTQQARHARAFRPQVDALAAQIGQARDLRFVAHEQPDRFGKQAAQRHQAAPFDAVGVARLRRSSRFARRRCRPARPATLQIVLRAERALQRDLDVVARQHARILLAKLLVGADFPGRWPGGACAAAPGRPTSRRAPRPRRPSGSSGRWPRPGRAARRC